MEKTKPNNVVIVIVEITDCDRVVWNTQNLLRTNSYSYNPACLKLFKEGWFKIHHIALFPRALHDTLRHDNNEQSYST